MWRPLGGLGVVRRLCLLALLVQGCQCDPTEDEACNRGAYDVISVGETLRLKLGRPDWFGDCRPTADPPRGFVWQTKATAPVAWQGAGPTVQLEPDGTLRGLAPGSFKAVARRGKQVFETEGIVVPEGTKMTLEPENPTMRVGESVPMRVAVTDPSGKALPGIRFSIFPEIPVSDDAEDIVRGPGLITSTENVPFRAFAEGTTTLTAYVGARPVGTTRLTVRGRRDRPDSGDAESSRD